ncbi:hypothetical protein NQ317_017158 [Molorchus minor]|uniref:Uncharacterized protein n=1 Tax=Molorchus minor TaxID=1323400 RepID=A0ABQ9J0R1_9CUCU|nr:hypothetical protein NQ317_017158 [Molorchus minor]
MEDPYVVYEDKEAIHTKALAVASGGVGIVALDQEEVNIRNLKVHRLLIWAQSSKFLCSEVIAPIRSEVDDISLIIVNFEDLTTVPAPSLENSPIGKK